MPSRWPSLAVFLLTGFILLIFTNPLLAETELEKKMKELDEINAAISKYEKMYEQKKKEEGQVLRQIKVLEDNIDVLEGDIQNLSSRVSETEGLIALVQTEIAEATGLVNKRTDYFNERLRQIYTDGSLGYLEVLFKATSFTDYLTRFDFLKYIAQNDVKLLDELVNARKILLSKKLELEEQKELYTALKGQKEGKQQQLELQSRQKSSLLKTIQEQKEEYIKTIDELEDVRKGIDEFIRQWQAQHATVYMGSGKMAWPVPGYSRISSGFGYRIHPIFRVKRFHPAIDIPAPKGTPVIAAERGKVLYMGTKGGYGKAIILDHGGGMSTQYSHLDQYANIRIGDIVNKGQTIGKVGSTGWSTGPHLDFIVRLQGEPQNPTLYVKP